MASGGKRGGAGERVLESRHVIGLFMLMLLFSGVFFTLGYVMGRNEYDGSGRAATDFFKKPRNSVTPKMEANSKRPSNPAPAAAPPNSYWEVYHAGDSKKTEDHLRPVPVAVKAAPPPRPSGASPKALNAPSIPGGSYTLQVAALRKESVALELANRLQKKKFPAFVLPPQGDKYYRVQVGPYADSKSADAARKGLEDAGFKAIVKH